MNEREFSVGDKKFKLSKIDAFKQFHIVRRLGPILGDIIPMAKEMIGVENKELTDDQKFEVFAKLTGPIMNGLSKLSDKDADLILKGLCSAVEMSQPESNSWVRISNGEVMSVQTLELPTLLQIAGRAFIYNLSGFFAIAPQTSHGGK